MRLILAVYDALRTFDRPCSRTEVEVATGLDRAAVRNGLDGLRLRQLVVIEGSPRRPATYQLRPGARRPEEIRGKGERSPDMRARIAAGVIRYRAAAPHLVLRPAPPGPYRAARAPSHRTSPGVARTTIAAQSAVALLIKHWRKP